MRKNWQILTIITLSVLTHFLFFGYPNETVSDEVHFGKYISGYFAHEYFFDVHPPLGKLLISAMGYVGGFKPGFAFAKIGEPFPDRSYLWLRFLPTLAGTLLPVVIYYLVIHLGISTLGAFAASLLTIFDNSLLVQSRFILLDSLLLLFGFSSLLSYFYFIRKKHILYLLLSGALAGLCFSVKWTGLTFPALILIVEVIAAIHSKVPSLSSSLRTVASLLLLPLAIYCGVFLVHLRLLYKSGPGDAFMTPRFQKTLQGSAFANDASIAPVNFLEAFQELNVAMYKANATLTAGHPYGSEWYSWPFLVRPIFYWVKSARPSETARIYCLGNPLSWWASTVAILYVIVTLLFTFTATDKAKWKYLDHLTLLLITAYFLNLLPFIGIKRVMFLYHYMAALIFALIAMVYLIDSIEYVPLLTANVRTLGGPPTRGENLQGYLRVNKVKIFTILIIASMAAFLLFAPLTYGLPLTDKAYSLRVWLPTWK